MNPGKSPQHATRLRAACLLTNCLNPFFVFTALFGAFEQHNENLTFWDDLYWAITTMTTLGSEIRPTTTGGEIVSAVVLLVGQALIGLNYVLEGDPLPWFLRAMQWLGLALALVGLGAAAVATVSLVKRGIDPIDDQPGLVTNAGRTAPSGLTPATLPVSLPS